MKRRVLLTAAGALGVAAMPFGAMAQAYPTKPITMIVPFAAGGPTDALARVLGQRMSEALGQQIVIENVGGAGGTIGVNKAAKATPDGYALLFAHMGTLAVSIALYKSLPYDSQRDLEPIGLGGTNPMVLEIPYKGTGPALIDLVIGQFDYMIDQAMNVLAQIQAGNIKALCGRQHLEAAAAASGRADHRCFRPQGL